ncbi:MULTISPECIES: FAD-dependent urate hydroxylase HpxO [Mycolicibacterium]|uniref:FAD-dependent urate hydroxylase n=1 Tax=Mycolicibacterium vanbaalenii (strain DSM 7251 / JCM 13017 / BCRC 16820 / KCTC 9966 / NRRL B-24157 / PYR-1) TaxID=350058 RepID=HPXO_MYCVP|nr:MULTISPECIES: FAD-dependent urate hydroxylase HpxO [Mycolicibacterium]A1TFU9.1 RecName: Full=FAD-dependent urate hydroxylase; AltName: Full=Flavoprotein urate hydroxylase [Mycolicibacterium vanbaalenii PYR-1]ABM16049.1 monooxygenase, FAD-binding protein [Mycolicibacterium vanbaalenii PYR-1]MCV7129653.1 FAD-dependent urate hydroxylase HpxO [Mycolicibacterium vanbaalenii PYR-1]PQP39818.1 monooxygenase [Mycolicibacterium austroafricanum]QZT56446.1 FAD-dependent urate hydroxylase HpxO [Mycolici
MKVVIVGAGMGGMSAAIALRQIGIDTVVYERVTENKPVGAAISVWSNGVKCLNYLGLQEETAELGGKVETMSYVDGHTGDTMCRFSMHPLIEQVGQRPYPIARAELQLMLMKAYGIDDINFGMKMVGVENDTAGSAAKATFADGTTVSADVIIGADGAGSITREYVLGGPVSRRYAGYVNYNGLVSTDDAIGPATEWTTYVGDGKRVSVMPVSDDRFYFFFDVVEPQGSPYEEGRVREVLRAHFAGWTPGVQTLIDTLDPLATNRVEILDLDPFHTWVKGRVAVLGDAAHNTTPDIGQGGCSAMEDAIALQWAFKDHPDDVHAALAAYQSARTERAADLVLRARKRCDVTHAKDPQVTSRWYDELRNEDGTNIIRGIVGNIVGGPLTPVTAATEG